MNHLLSKSAAWKTDHVMDSDAQICTETATCPVFLDGSGYGHCCWTRFFTACLFDIVTFLDQILIEAGYLAWKIESATHIPLSVG